MPSDTQPIRVAVVEDRCQDRDALITLLQSSAGFECVAACSCTSEALETLPQRQPQVMLMDINMPGQSGIECVRRLRPVLPETEFMMLTVYEDHWAIYQSLAAGATGYLLKKTSPPEILHAIRELSEGGAPMSGQIARKVVGAFRQASSPSRTSPPPVEAQLSFMEQSVLQRLSRGLLYKEVAEE